jgi:hypothetical protein
MSRLETLGHPEEEDQEELYGVRCDDCEFNVWRGLPEKIAEKVALGHQYVTGHIPELYVIDHNTDGSNQTKSSGEGEPSETSSQTCRTSRPTK